MSIDKLKKLRAVVCGFDNDEYEPFRIDPRLTNEIIHDLIKKYDIDSESEYKACLISLCPDEKDIIKNADPEWLEDNFYSSKQMFYYFEDEAMNIVKNYIKYLDEQESEE